MPPDTHEETDSGQHEPGRSWNRVGNGRVEFVRGDPVVSATVPIERYGSHGIDGARPAIQVFGPLKSKGQDMPGTSVVRESDVEAHIPWIGRRTAEMEIGIALIGDGPGGTGETDILKDNIVTRIVVIQKQVDRIRLVFVHESR